MKRILALEEGPGFGGALVSLSQLLEHSSPSEYGFHLISNYAQQRIRIGGAIERVSVVERPRIYGFDSRLEQALRHVLGRKAGPAAYVIDRLTTGRRYVNALVKYIRTHDIDLVHLNNWPLLNDGGLLAALKTGRPVVMHIRGIEYSGRLIGHLARQADHVIAISEHVRRQTLQLGVRDDRISVIPNAVDVKSFVSGANGRAFRGEIGIAADRPLIGLVACLVGWKGHRVFLEACAKVLPGSQAEAVIVGDTPDASPAYRLELEALARDLGLADRVRFAGHRNDVASAMQACDVVVHASTLPEPFGRVLIEAMALGRPVIATAPGGPSEIITDGVDGFLIPPSDPDALAGAMRRCLNDEALRAAIGQRASRTAIDRYDVAAHVQRVAAVYEEVARQKASGAKARSRA